MSNLVSLIVAIAIGAILMVATFLWMGEAYTEQNIKAKAVAALNEIDQINSALMAYVSFNQSVKIGFSDPNDDGDFSDSEIFRALEEEDYLKNTQSMVDTGGYYLDKTSMAFSKIIQDEEICLQVNHVRNQHPKEGLTVGDTVRGYGSVIADDLVGSLPKCGSGLGNKSVCCVKE